MRQMIRFSAANILAMCSVFFVPAAAFADPPHFLSDNFALPSVPPGVAAKKPFARLNNHLERIPKAYMVYGLHGSANGKLICTDRLGHPALSFPSTKAFLLINNSHQQKQSLPSICRK